MNREKLNTMKDEVNQLPTDILSFSELKWTEIGHFQTDLESYYSDILLLRGKEKEGKVLYSQKGRILQRQYLGTMQSVTKYLQLDFTGNLLI